MSRTAALLGALALFCALSAAAQSPSADWRTLATPHFRVHYPASSEAWTRRAAARLESIRDRVAAEVGYAPPEIVDVVVSDPVADPNGMAYPILGWPRMILWTSPPGPESDLGHYTDWSDLLVAHEETHLAHLLRPSRNPLRQVLTHVAPVGPIPLAAPRWVLEGYATVVEGRLTGAGRPHGDIRAAILRRWAQAGKLPTYPRLASDRGSWRGMSMAYLAGSAYLEWLEERAGPGSLRKLWARMTARSPRSFDDAFRGVFGESPADLYDRFRAELTWRALESERRLAGVSREGALWQDLAWTVGAPAVTPDGQHLVIELDHKDRPSRLVVWSTAPDTEGEKKRQEKIQQLLARDPEDVAPVLTSPPGRKPLHTLESRDGIEATTPRWTADGKAVLYVRFEPDREGFLHPDLFRWQTESGAVERLTQRADLREPDPSPIAADPDWAVAVRNRDGASAVVRIDLRTGAVTEITAPSVEEVVDRPRIAPDGRRVVFARHREGVWRLVVRDLASGAETVLAPPDEGTASSPAWSADGRTVYASVGIQGFVDLWAFAVDDPAQPPVRLTRTQGAALSPAPMPDDSAIFYLSLEHDGLDLRRLDLTPGPSPIALPSSGRGAPPPPPERKTADSEDAFSPLPGVGSAMGEGGQGGEVSDLAPAVSPASQNPPPSPFAAADVPPGQPYGIGRQEILPLVSASGSPAGAVTEIGVRSGDVVGRLDVLALLSLGADGWPSGGGLAGVWKGRPVAVGFHAYGVSERPARQRGPLRFDPAADVDREGVELSASWDGRWDGARLALATSGLLETVESSRFEATEHHGIASLRALWTGWRVWNGTRLTAGANAHFEPGRTSGDAWRRYGGTASLDLSQDKSGLSLSWRRDTSSGTLHFVDFYQLGGTETSVLARTATSEILAIPALPFGYLTGQEHEGERAELRLGFLPAPVFWERHRVWDRFASPGGWLTLAGLEWRFSLAPFPIARVPGLDLRLGVARILDDPSPDETLQGDTRWWLTAVWRP